ncbi:MAG: hypothetical protein Q8N21_04740 [bacterium]|nr:hypothetical protein [bacterium]
MKYKLLLLIALFASVILIAGCINKDQGVSDSDTEKNCCNLCTTLPSDKPSCWVILSANNGPQKCIDFFKDNPKMISECEEIQQ